MDLNDEEGAHVQDTPIDASESHSRPLEIARKYVDNARQQRRNSILSKRRFSSDFEQQTKHESLNDVLSGLQASKFYDLNLLKRLKSVLASGQENPEEFFLSGCGDQHLFNLVNIMSTNGHANQLMAVEIMANLSPLSEKNGLKFARSAGPYLITLLSSSSPNIQEASSVALGNLALAGFKVVKVLLHQDVLKRLTFNIPECTLQILDESDTKGEKSWCGEANKTVSATLYAIYHIIHTVDRSGNSSAGSSENFMGEDDFSELIERCTGLLMQLKAKAPLELFWVLFVLSCQPPSHSILTKETTIYTHLDICTYEIYQKSDPRPLVKVVTPICRLLANLCGSSSHGEQACLFVLRHPDVTALLMALLGTNYMHLCKETMWLFANIVNSESVLVQEEIVELNLMDKLEYHTTSAVQKIDPYAVR